MTEKRPDQESDPSLDDGTSTDWSGEGGALPDGPATEPEAAEESSNESDDS